MAPVKRRLTRSSAVKGGVAGSSKPSPAKKSPLPKQPLKARRVKKNQPRIDETLKTGKRGRRAKRVLKQKEIEGANRTNQGSTFTITSAEDQKTTAKLSQSSSSSSDTLEFACPGGSPNSPLRSLATALADSANVEPRLLTKKEEELEILRAFDIEATYGSCRGMSRRERYERALRFQLKPSPSPRILTILNQHKDDPNYYLDWETWYDNNNE